MLPCALTQQSAGQAAWWRVSPSFGAQSQCLRACVSSACGLWSVPSWPRLALKEEEPLSGGKSAHRVIDELLIGLTSPAPPTPH